MLTVTREIRKILRETNSSHSIFTNRYKKCRTVKCYINPDKDINESQVLIEKLCAEQNIPVTFKRVRTIRYAYGAPGYSFIVRLPLEA